MDLCSLTWYINFISFIFMCLLKWITLSSFHNEERVYGWKNKRELRLNPKPFTMSLVYSFYNDIHFYFASENNEVNLTPIDHWTLRHPFLYFLLVLIDYFQKSIANFSLFPKYEIGLVYDLDVRITSCISVDCFLKSPTSFS